MLREKSAKLIYRKIGCLCNALKGYRLTEILIYIVHGKVDRLMGIGAAIYALALQNGAVDVDENFGHNSTLYKVITVSRFT